MATGDDSWFCSGNWHQRPESVDAVAHKMSNWLQRIGQILLGLKLAFPCPATKPSEVVLNWRDKISDEEIHERTVAGRNFDDCIPPNLRPEWGVSIRLLGQWNGLNLEVDAHAGGYYGVGINLNENSAGLTFRIPSTLKDAKKILNAKTGIDLLRTTAECWDSDFGIWDSVWMGKANAQYKTLRLPRLGVITYVSDFLKEYQESCKGIFRSERWPNGIVVYPHSDMSQPLFSDEVIEEVVTNAVP